jgi:hypothetical protein
LGGSAVGVWVQVSKCREKQRSKAEKQQLRWLV